MEVWHAIATHVGSARDADALARVSSAARAAVARIWSAPRFARPPDTLVSLHAGLKLPAPRTIEISFPPTTRRLDGGTASISVPASGVARIVLCVQHAESETQWVGIAEPFDVAMLRRTSRFVVPLGASAPHIHGSTTPFIEIGPTTTVEDVRRP